MRGNGAVTRQPFPLRSERPAKTDLGHFKGACIDCRVPPPEPERERRYCFGPRARRVKSLARQRPVAAKARVFYALDQAAHFLERHAAHDQREGPRVNR